MQENKNRDLKICIVGAGMGGLTAALALAKQGFNHIDVYEMAADLGFVGAGIQLAPNMARILDRLGCWSGVVKEAVVLKNTSIRKDSTETELACPDLRYIEKEYGYPHMVGHRSSLAGSIYKACKREKAVTFSFSSTVEDVLSFTPRPSLRIKPRSGEPIVVEADVLIAADGVKSIIRTKMLSSLQIDAPIIDTGQSAYRIMLSRQQIQHDPELLKLLDGDAATRWIGAKRHLIAYPVSRKQIYNISTTQPDINFAAAPSATYTTRGSKADMLAVFHDFCPRVKQLLSLAPEGEVCEWKLRVHTPLPTWMHGSVALLGDACHPTLPHLGQGATQAIEDAAVIAIALARLPSNANASPEAINTALWGYEHIRKERAERMVEMAAASGRALHLGEGAAKEERDRQFAEAKAKGARLPDKWADAEVQRMIYGHDCMKVAEEFFAEKGGGGGAKKNGEVNGVVAS